VRRLELVDVVKELFKKIVSDGDRYGHKVHESRGLALLLQPLVAVWLPIIETYALYFELHVIVLIRAEAVHQPFLKVGRLDIVQISYLLADLRGGRAILGSVLLEHVLVVAERQNNDHGEECEGCAEEDGD